MDLGTEGQKINQNRKLNYFLSLVRVFLFASEIKVHLKRAMGFKIKVDSNAFCPAPDWCHPLAVVHVSYLRGHQITPRITPVDSSCKQRNLHCFKAHEKLQKCTYLDFTCILFVSQVASEQLIFINDTVHVNKAFVFH